MKLRRHAKPPPGLMALPAAGLADFLGGPALIEVPGEEPETVFVSLLLHGNETSGWEAVRRWLRGLDGPPRRSHVLLIANPMAAA
ncbi:MAG: peptidase M14, partial [Ectothiorhodospiraceae bacterium AqS1]|nr:peptidase M14 [Ectothiorhodospiraceae bacterium AqS1]